MWHSFHRQYGIGWTIIPRNLLNSRRDTMMNYKVSKYIVLFAILDFILLCGMRRCLLGFPNKGGLFWHCLNIQIMCIYDAWYIRKELMDFILCICDINQVSIGNKLFHCIAKGIHILVPLSVLNIRCVKWSSLCTMVFCIGLHMYALTTSQVLLWLPSQLHLKALQSIYVKLGNREIRKFLLVVLLW